VRTRECGDTRTQECGDTGVHGHRDVRTGGGKGIRTYVHCIHYLQYDLFCNTITKL